VRKKEREGERGVGSGEWWEGRVESFARPYLTSHRSPLPSPRLGPAQPGPGGGASLGDADELAGAGAEEAHDEEDVEVGEVRHLQGRCCRAAHARGPHQHAAHSTKHSVLHIEPGGLQRAGHGAQGRTQTGASAVVVACCILSTAGEAHGEGKSRSDRLRLYAR
jgi:hypothetical protein